MAKYTVTLRGLPKGHKTPTLLAKFAKWLTKQPYGSVGYLDLVASAVPGSWGDADPEKLKNGAWCFGSLPDGSLLALITSVKPAPVVLFGSEGETQRLAGSLEAFLLALSRRKTKVSDLDEAEDSRRADLAAWLKQQQVKAPTAAKFSMPSYLSSIKRSSTNGDLVAIKKFPPHVRELVGMIGGSPEEPDVAKQLRRHALQPPKTKQTTVLTNKKRGIAIRLAKVRKINPSGLTVTEVTLDENYRKPLPLKIQFGVNDSTLKRALGKPTGKTKGGGTEWEKAVDEAAGLYLNLGRKSHFDLTTTLRFFLKLK